MGSARASPHDHRAPEAQGPDASWSPQAARACRFLDALPGPAWMKDLDGRYVYVNDAAANALGLTLAEVYGRPDDEILPRDVATDARRNDAKVLASGEPFESIELLRAGATDRSMLVTRFAVHCPATFLCGYAVDITSRARLENELRNAVLRKREFLATVAHEMRNPLAPITTALNILEHQGGHPPEVQRLHDLIRRQARVLAHLVEDLMDAARVASNRINVRLCATNLVTVLHAALETSRPQIEAARHAFDCALPQEALPVMADARRLAQVFSNLLNNAAKFTPEGGRIELDARRVDDFVVVRVRDDGIGIVAQALPRIFELFQQGEPPERAQGGLGVGLALVKRLVELHGGKVSATSEGAGCGSEFVVRLPLLPPSAHRGDGERGAGVAAGGRILIVDDNRDAADSLAQLIALFGDEACVAYDGASAIAMSMPFAPQIALLDLGMPEMSGFEVAQKLREAHGAQLTLVAVTGWGDEEIRKRTRAAGFDYHLVKPVELESIRALLAANAAPIAIKANDP